MAGSSFRAGASHPGSQVSAGALGTLFDPGAALIQQTVANAFTAPADTPAEDQIRVQRDGTFTTIWTFDTTDGWRYVEVAA